jgi:hypothetical protein
VAPDTVLFGWYRFPFSKPHIFGERFVNSFAEVKARSLSTAELELKEAVEFYEAAREASAHRSSWNQ